MANCSVSTIPLFKVQEAVRFAAARAGAREALRNATALAADNPELIEGLRQLVNSAERFGQVTMIFNRQAVGGAK